MKTKNKILILGGIVILFFFCISVTRADVGEVPAPGGAITLGEKTKKIRMNSEKVVFQVMENKGTFSEDVSHYAHVTADFFLENITGSKVEKRLFFPFHFTNDLEQAGNPPQAINIKVFVQNKEIGDLKYENFELANPYNNLSEVKSGVFKAYFLPGEETHIRVKYDLRAVNLPKSPVLSLEYLLETGSHWEGSIGTGQITFDFWEDIDSKVVLEKFNDFFEIKDGNLVWDFTDLTPTQLHNIQVAFNPDHVANWNSRPEFLQNISASQNQEQIRTCRYDDCAESFAGFPIPYKSHVLNLIDSDSPKGGWIVESSSDISDNWVSFTFPENYKFEALQIRTGVLDTEGREETERGVSQHYDTFKRPETIEVIFSDGSQNEFNLEDLPGQFQMVELNPTFTNMIKIAVKSSYAGVGQGNNYLGIGRIDFIGAKSESAEKEAENGGSTTVDENVPPFKVGEFDTENKSAKETLFSMSGLIYLGSGFVIGVLASVLASLIFRLVRSMGSGKKEEAPESFEEVKKEDKETIDQKIQDKEEEEENKEVEESKEEINKEAEETQETEEETKEKENKIIFTDIKTENREEDKKEDDNEEEPEEETKEKIEEKTEKKPSALSVGSLWSGEEEKYKKLETTEKKTKLLKSSADDEEDVEEEEKEGDNEEIFSEEDKKEKNIKPPKIPQMMNDIVKKEKDSDNEEEDNEDEKEEDKNKNKDEDEDEDKEY